jgi:hypothetical protein
MSFIEEISSGGEVPLKIGMIHGETNALQEATLQNAQYNMIHKPAQSGLMYQHIQFRRIEKFIKNYFDVGKVTKEVNQNDKIL